MDFYQSLSLFFVGVASAANGILGFSVFLSDRKYRADKAFLFFVLSTIPWGILNYFVFQPSPFPSLAIWVLRGSVFFAVLYCFFLYRLLFVFPNEEKNFPKYYYFLILPLVVFTALLTLTPAV